MSNFLVSEDKKKLKIQLKVFQENNSLGGFAQTNNNNNSTTVGRRKN